ncbi:MAG: TolC family protein [Gemmatimonadales bacterium]
MIALFIGALAMATAQDTVVLSLQESTARATVASPAVLSAEGAVFASLGERRQSFSPFLEDLSVEYERARRTSSGGTSYDSGWRLSQEVDFASWLSRRSAAGSRLDAARATVLDARRTAALEARLAYLDLRLAEARATLADSNAAFMERLADASRRRLELGEINLLERNTALLESSRARSEADRLAAGADISSANLARLLALPGQTVIKTLPLPDLPPTIDADEGRLVALARSRRPDLAAALSSHAGASTAVTAAKLSNLPSLELSGFSAREEDSDDLLGFSVSLKVPLFTWNQTEIGRAEAEQAYAEAQLAVTQRTIQAEISAMQSLFTRATAAERRFASDVLVAADENVALTDRAFAEGKVDIMQALVLRAVAVNARLEYLAVRQDAYTAWFLLAAALGVEPTNLNDPSGVGL